MLIVRNVTITDLVIDNSYLYLDDKSIHTFLTNFITLIQSLTLTMLNKNHGSPSIL
jgi:hypothetical protein